MKLLASQVALVVKNLLDNAVIGKIPWKRAWQLTPVFVDFPGGSDDKNLSIRWKTQV